MKYLIAEFGNNHLGDIEKAKQYIRIAKECGATHAKGQAFMARDITSGSMPTSFYYKCELKFSEYVELIDYGEEIGIPVFFSIFSKHFESLVYHQEWYKIAGCQVKLGFKELAKKDCKKMFVSVPEFTIMPQLEKSHILHVTPYNYKTPDFKTLDFLNTYYERPCGLSDHCIGIDFALKAITERGIPVLEKHFTLSRDIKYKGQLFRDCVHAADPKQLEILAKEIN